MDEFFKSLKRKLSVDNFMSESNNLDEDSIKEEDVRKTLEKIDIEIVDVDEIASKLKEVSESSKPIEDKKSQPFKKPEAPKSNFSILQKPSQPELEKVEDLSKPEEILFYD